MSPEARLDALSEHAVELALSPCVAWPELVPALIKAHPDATVLDVAAAVARAAAALEDTAPPEGPRTTADRLHRLASVTTMDAWRVGRRGWSDVRVRDMGLYRRLHGRLGIEAPEIR